MTQPFQAGGLITTDHEAVDLGVHHGVQLEGRVVRRTLRIGVGGRRGVRLELARARPTSVRSIGPGGDVEERLPTNPDPWLEAAQRLLALTVASALLPWLLRRSRFAQRSAE